MTKSSSLLIVTGDFNGETGKRNYINECLRNVSQGIRIKSDQHIVNFCAQQNLKISNTYFYHKQIIMVTWKQTGNVQNKVQKLSKTLDFICVQRKHIQLLQNSRLYHRTISTSDNKIVIAGMKIQWFEMLIHTNKTKKNTSQRKIKNELLITNKKNKRINHKSYKKDRWTKQRLDKPGGKHGKHSRRSCKVQEMERWLHYSNPTTAKV